MGKGRLRWGGGRPHPKYSSCRMTKPTSGFASPERFLRCRRGLALLPGAQNNPVYSAAPGVSGYSPGTSLFLFCFGGGNWPGVTQAERAQCWGAWKAPSLLFSPLPSLLCFALQLPSQRREYTYAYIRNTTALYRGLSWGLGGL